MLAGFFFRSNNSLKFSSLDSGNDVASVLCFSGRHYNNNNNYAFCLLPFIGNIHAFSILNVVAYVILPGLCNDIL
jgi:hypothetical protein